jgi:hypothetical protein
MCPYSLNLGSLHAESNRERAVTNAAAKYRGRPDVEDCNYFWSVVNREILAGAPRLGTTCLTRAWAKSYQYGSSSPATHESTRKRWLRGQDLHLRSEVMSLSYETLLADQKQRENFGCIGRDYSSWVCRNSCCRTNRSTAARSASPS